MKRLCGLLIPAVLLVLLAAEPRRTHERLLREAVAAHQAGDLARAVNLYRQLEESTPEPGKVAFNLATALHDQALASKDASLLAEAAEYYRRCTGDADRDRRARALYGLGTTILQWKQNDRGLLLEAIRSLRACSRLAVNSPLGRDARHNLELARLFLNRLPEPSEAEQPPEEDPGTSENFVPRKQPLDRQQPRAEPGDDPPQGEPNRQTGQPTDKGQEQPRTTEQPSPSSAPKPDAGRERAKLRPRSREEALRELRRLEAEILREYRADSELNTTRTHGEKVKDH